MITGFTSSANYKKSISPINSEVLGDTYSQGHSIRIFFVAGVLLTVVTHDGICFPQIPLIFAENINKSSEHIRQICGKKGPVRKFSY